MSKLPRITGKELIRALTKLGFIVNRVKGSHHHLAHADGRVTVVPVHAGENIGIGLFFKILRDCELSKEDIINII